MTKVVVAVEYCGGWGYAPRYERLQRAILAEVPTAECTGTVGRKSSFEVTINGTLVYSKLKKDSFPTEEEIVKLVKAAAEGK